MNESGGKVSTMRVNTNGIVRGFCDFIRAESSTGEKEMWRRTGPSRARPADGTSKWTMRKGPTLPLFVSDSENRRDNATITHTKPVNLYRTAGYF